MDMSEPAPAVVRQTLRLEELTALDGTVRALEPWVRRLFGGGRQGSLLRGEWLGHAVHPVLTDVAIGCWTSASILDVVGGRQSAAGAQLLVGTGVVVAIPTAWTGWAEWSALSSRDKRVGLVHALTNAVAIGAYAGSWRARRRGRRGTGVALAMAGAGVSGFGAYLGGHLTEGRRVASHHPAYDDPRPGA